MNLPDEKREAVRRLLDEHQPLPITETGLVHIGYGCPAPCCWGNEGGYDLDAHRRHLADALAPTVAGLIEDARREDRERHGRELHEALTAAVTAQRDRDALRERLAGVEALFACGPNLLRHYYAIDSTCQRCGMPSWVESRLRAVLHPEEKP